MATFRQGSFSLNLGVFEISADLDEDDRQCAWELYVEMTSRVAVCGKLDERGAIVFDGEVLAQSLDSLHAFFVEARALLRRYPVGRLGRDRKHLAYPVAKLLNGAIRPFLERWQAHFRHWWEQSADAAVPPFERQRQYPFLREFLDHWRAVRQVCREVAGDLRKSGGFPDLLDLVPPDARKEWVVTPPTAEAPAQSRS